MQKANKLTPNSSPTHQVFISAFSSNILLDSCLFPAFVHANRSLYKAKYLSFFLYKRFGSYTGRMHLAFCLYFGGHSVSTVSLLLTVAYFKVWVDHHLLKGSPIDSHLSYE